MKRAWVWSPEVSRLTWAIALLAAWLAVATGVAARLPPGVASPLVFLGLVIAPGYLLGDLLARRWRPDTLERLALAFPLGVVVLAVPGMVALFGHLTIDQLARGWQLASATVVAVWLVAEAARLLRRGRADGPGRPWAWDEIALFLLTLGMFALAFPALRLSKIDGDAYAVATFAADALAGLPMNAREPLFGTEIGPGARMVFNQSLTLSYLWSHFSGIAPIPLWSDFSRWVLAPWALFAAYMLGKSGGARRLGLLVAAIQMLIFLAAPFLRGDNVSLFFFERINADKFLVPAAMLPVLFALAIRMASAGEGSGRAGGAEAVFPSAALTALAISAIHPFIAAMTAVALSGFAGLHLLLGLRSRAAWARAGAVGLLIALVMSLPLVELFISRGEETLVASFPSSVEGWPVGARWVAVLPGLYAPTLAYHGPLPSLQQLDAAQAGTTGDPFLMWRFAVNMGRRRLILFDLDRYIADPNLIFEPPYLLALLILPFLLRGIRRDLAAQFAVGSTLAALFAMFNPWLTPVIGSLVMPWILWRFVWIIPYALLIGLGVERSGGAEERRSGGARGKVLRPLGPVVLPLLILLMAPLIARNLKTLGERVEYPTFFPAPSGILEALKALAKEPSVVLAPQDLSVTIPAYVANANVVAHRAPTTSEVFPADRQGEALQRLIDQDAFFKTPYLTERSLAILRRWGVDFVAVPAGARLEAQLQLAPYWFRWLADDASYSLYAVTMPPEPTDAIRGNGLFAARRWDEARAAYLKALDADSDDLIALAGMADLSHTLGDFDASLSYLQRALAVADLPVLHFRIGGLLTEMGRVEEATAALRKAEQGAPHVAAYHAAVGDTCLVSGDLTCAANEYRAASATRPLPGEDARLIAEAELWRQRGRLDRGLSRYEEAAALRPTPYNRLLLAGAYREAGQLESATGVANALRREYPFSAPVLAAAADLADAMGRSEEAADLYRRAMFLLQLQAQDETDVRLALARTLLDGGQLAAAKRQVETALTRAPESAEAYRLTGDIRSRSGDADGALAAYRRAFALDPAQIDTYLALRNQLRAQGAHPDEAEDVLRAAEVYNPTEASLALDRGDQLQRSGDSRGALDAYRQALEALQEAAEAGPAGAPPADGSRAFVFARLAELHEDLGQPREAMGFYRAAVAASHAAPWAERSLGDALRRQGEYAAAETAYRAALAADPGYVDAYERLADLLRAQGDEAGSEAIRDRLPDLAVARLEAPLTVPALVAGSNGAASAALQSDETLLARPLPTSRSSNLDAGAQLVAAESDASALRVLAGLRQTQGQNARALQLYRARIAFASQQHWDPVIVARYWSHLGSLALADGDITLAGEAYRKALALDGWRPDAYLGLANVAAAQGQPAEALRLARRAVQAAPGSVEARIALAASLEAFGGADEAIFLYDTTAQAHPGNAQAVLALARALQAARREDEAEKRFIQARAAAPGLAAPHVGLAEIRAGRGEEDAARALLEQAIAADRADPMPYVRLAEMAARAGDAEAATARYAEAMARAGDAIAPAVAASLLQNARYAEAAAFVAERLADRPGDAELLREQARAARALGQYAEAAESLRQAAAMAPATGRPLAELADLYRLQGRLNDAESAYLRAQEREPQAVEYVLGLAGVLAAKGDRPLALIALAEGRLRADRPEALDGMAHDLRMLSGDADGALVALERQADGESLEREMLRAAHDAARGRFDEALARYQASSARYPKEVGVWLALSDLQLRRSAADEALAAADEAIRVRPTHGAPWLARARALSAAGRDEEALPAYRRAIRLSPASPEAYLRLAILYAAAGRADEAQAIYAEGMKAAPGSSGLLEAYGSFLVERGQEDAALSMLDAAVLAAPSASNLAARAAVFKALGRPADARRDLEDAIEREPGALEPRLALGDLLRDTGDDAGAVQLYDSAVRAAPGHPAAYLRLAELAAEGGDTAGEAAWRKKAESSALAGLAGGAATSPRD